MNLIKSALFALIAGLLGAAVWAAIAYFANFELGWLAWGIGFIVGAAALAGAGRGGVPVAALAVAIAVLSVAGGKYAAVSLSVSKFISENGLTATPTDELLTSYLADRVIEEHEQAGESIDWPGGSLPDMLESEDDYPPAIWDEASARWSGMTPDEQAAFRDTIRADQQAAIDQIAASARVDAFKSSFTIWDLLWFGLAVFTAFKIGMSSDETTDPPTEPGAAEVMSANVHTAQPNTVNRPSPDMLSP